MFSSDLYDRYSIQSLARTRVVASFLCSAQSLRSRDAYFLKSQPLRELQPTATSSIDFARASTAIRNFRSHGSFDQLPQPRLTGFDFNFHLRASIFHPRASIFNFHPQASIFMHGLQFHPRELFKSTTFI